MRTPCDDLGAKQNSGPSLRQRQRDGVGRFFEGEDDLGVVHVVSTRYIHGLGAVLEALGLVSFGSPIFRFSKIKPGAGITKQYPHKIRSISILVRPVNSNPPDLAQRRTLEARVPRKNQTNERRPTAGGEPLNEGDYPRWGVNSYK